MCCTAAQARPIRLPLCQSSKHGKQQVSVNLYKAVQYKDMLYRKLVPAKLKIAQHCGWRSRLTTHTIGKVSMNMQLQHVSHADIQASIAEAAALVRCCLSRAAV